MEGARVSVQEGVEEPKRALSGRDQTVVDERNDRGEDGTRAARAVDDFVGTVHDDLNVGADGCDVGVRTARGVELAAVRGADRFQVRRDDGGLVRGCAEVVGETAR